MPPPTTIRVWMAPDVAASVDQAKRRQAARRATRNTTSAVTGQHQVRTGGITTNADGSARIPVRATLIQVQYLEALFGGPLLLQKLIATHDAPIQNRAAASLFLLKHHKEIAPHLFEENREQAVDWLTGLVQQWSTSPPQEIGLEMPGTISSVQDIHLSLRQIGPLAPKDKLALERLRHKRRYITDFVLTRIDGKYFVDISFASATTVGSTRTANVQPARRPSSTKALPLSAFLAMFDSAMNARLRAELRISQQYSRTQFEKLEGWGVHGGLPSLGKRR
jgi:hypothetical protein